MLYFNIKYMSNIVLCCKDSGKYMITSTVEGDG